MVYAGILAAGLSVRMHRQDMPTPFLLLGEKTIIQHTLEQFYANPDVDRIIIVAPENWKLYMADFLARCPSMGKESFIISGGANKTESIYFIVRYIEKTWGISNDDILIAHDAIRPFITQRIINENITVTKQYSAANTAMVTNDAILVSIDGSLLDDVPSHDQFYAEQTPQTYKISKLKSSIAQALATGAVLEYENELPRLYINEGNEMRLVRGEYFNIKIINPYDLAVANALLRERAL